MGMRRPRIKRTTESFRSPEGDVYLRRPSAARDVKIEQPRDLDERLLAALDGEHTLEQLRHKRDTSMAVTKEMKDAGVFVYGNGGIDASTALFSVELGADGEPVFTDGPYVETKEHLGGFCIVDVPDDETAKMWAGKVAVGCGWPQEVRRIGTPPDVD